MTVDPCSSAILRIELSETRQAEDWKNHFECLMNNSVEAIYLVSHDGTGLRAGHIMQHWVIRLTSPILIMRWLIFLGNWVDRLEASAYKEEHEREQRVQSKKSKQAKENQQQHFQQAQKAREVAIREYEGFGSPYDCLINELNILITTKAAYALNSRQKK